ncbi:MAG: permease-like cell division protein FtsX [Oscillospiraceae bacterium]|nr:permease-like cell division protein FtsX [Oscillospiraceae bacterium]MDD7429749.1 permease-like cell division protein FtsX [Oscillospiraceae bacterium]MDY2848568.1 permease-like cell division protein FtsX [Oscillospiraceae bacterium]
MRFSSVTYLAKQGLKNIWTNRIMSFASLCILTVSLLLVGFAVLFVENINLFVGNIENKNEVILFLEDDITDEQIDEMGNRLKAMSNVGSVTFYSKEEAFEDMKAGMENAEELFEYIGDDSPLPDSYRLRVNDIGKMSSTLMQINELDGIYSVKAPTDFVSVLTGVRSLIYILSLVLITALIVVCLIIISNTTRASVDFRKREIAIMKYVGATNTFIKIPFFIEGLLMGVFAGIIATVITWLGYDALVDVLMSDTTLWSALGISGFIPFSSVALRTVLTYILAGAFIGSIGTVISTRKYVKV